MKVRCSNPKSQAYVRYGARGITVCERWHSFENFYADMGERPEGMTLDREDNNKGYEPGNCRWATRREQTRNRNITISLSFNGRTQPLAAWAEELGLSYYLLLSRYKAGWSIERLLTTQSRAVANG